MVHKAPQQSNRRKKKYRSPETSKAMQPGYCSFRVRLLSGKKGDGDDENMCACSRYALCVCYIRIGKVTLKSGVYAV